MSDPILNEIEVLKASTEEFLSGFDAPDEIRVSFCSCGERFFDDDPDVNRHVRHAHITKRFVVAPWQAGAGE